MNRKAVQKLVYLAFQQMEKEKNVKNSKPQLFLFSNTVLNCDNINYFKVTSYRQTVVKTKKNKDKNNLNNFLWDIYNEM